MKNNYHTERVLRYIVPICLGLLSIGIVLFYLIPVASGLPERQTNLDSAKSELAALKEKQSSLQSLNSQELDDMTLKADFALPTEKSFAGLLSGLEGLSNEAGAKLLTFDSSPGLISKVTDKTLPQLTDLPNGLKFLEAKVGIKSNIAQLVNLSAQLKKSSRLATLETVTFSSDSVDQQGANVDIKLQVYYQPDVATPSAQSSFSPISQEERDVIAKVDSFNRFSLEVPGSVQINANPFVNLAPQPTASSSSNHP